MKGTTCSVTIKDANMMIDMFTNHFDIDGTGISNNKEEALKIATSDWMSQIISLIRESFLSKTQQNMFICAAEEFFCKTSEYSKGGYDTTTRTITDPKSLIGFEYSSEKAVHIENMYS